MCQSSFVLNETMTFLDFPTLYNGCKNRTTFVLIINILSDCIAKDFKPSSISFMDICNQTMERKQGSAIGGLCN